MLASIPLLISKKTTPTKTAAKGGASSKQNTPNKKTPGAKSVIDITNSPASKKKSPKKKSAAKTTPCVVDLSKDNVSGKKGSAKKTPKTTTTKNTATPKTKSPAKKSTVTSRSSSPGKKAFIAKSTKSPNRKADGIISSPLQMSPARSPLLTQPVTVNVDLTVDKPTTLPEVGNTSTSVSVLVGTSGKQSEDGSPLPVMVKETVMDHLGNTAVKFKQLGHLVQTADNNSSGKTETTKKVSYDRTKDYFLITSFSFNMVEKLTCQLSDIFTYVTMADNCGSPKF